MKKLFLSLAALALVASVYSCRETKEENLEESAEMQTENAMDEAGDAIDNAAEATEEAMEDAGDAVENAAEETKEAVEDATDGQ